MNSANDVRDLMTAIGGFNWNIYGISYGSRLALAVIKTSPERLRSVILDAVYPLEIDELLETPFLYDNALSILLDSCQTTKSCQSTCSDLESSFFKLLEQLKATPIELTVSEAETEQPISIQIDDHRLMEILFQALYRWDFIEMLPSAIVAAQEEDYDALKPFVQFYIDVLLDADFSDAVFLSVECHDSFHHTTREHYMTQVARFPRIKEFVKYHWDYNPCSVWPVEPADPSLHEPIQSTIPTLFLVGKYDPITPPVWAQQAAQHFSQGHVFVFPGIGHGVVDSDYCASSLALAFLLNPTEKPHDECILEVEFEPLKLLPNFE